MNIWLLPSLLLFMAPLAPQDENPYAKFAVNAIFDKRVQQELELGEKQKTEIEVTLKQLTDLRDEMAEELREMKMAGVTKQEILRRRDNLITRLEDEKKDLQKDLFEILLPHQVTRLNQLAAQIANREAAKKGKTNTGLLTPEMKDYLDIDDQQAERIKQRTSEIQKELAEKIRKLNEQAIEEQLKELTPSQREKYLKLMGKRLAN